MKNTKPSSPLAERLRPQTLAELVGQQHLLGELKPLNLCFTTGQLHSMILWGPPGVGKTTIARLMAKAFDCEWIALSAVFSGVKDIRASMELAQKNLEDKKQTVLFIDEIHRFNKAQQDALLPYTESGLIVLIGATTENPSFEVIPALLSRVQVYVLKALSDEELTVLLKRVQSQVLKSLVFNAEAVDLIIGFADGDARRLLNLLEQIKAACAHLGLSEVSKELVNQLLAPNVRRFNKAGDYFYDQISALHKSVRGSHPDAALYWFCRMLDGGADPKYLARRIIRMAWEDIGLADPRSMQIANEAAATYERLGSPEGELALAEAVLYLATAPKSNAAYKAFNEALNFVKKDKSREVPIHLRNAPTPLLSQLGHGKNYRYAHDEPHAYAAGAHYFPEGLSEPGWYQPVARGLELKIEERLAFLRKLDDDYKK